MTYKGYSARIEYEDEDGIMTGQIAGIRDGVGFQADSVEELKEAFHEAVDDYVETCAKIGKEPQKSYSGRVMFRVDPEVHRRAALLKMRPGRMATDATTHASANADGSWGFAPRAILDGVGDRPFSGA